ncbi:hypothetical protein WG66_009756 [Moniliophthora roreri]|nr:hypothetical protein WG66_009756 [Moniliophthora roreri]
MSGSEDYMSTKREERLSSLYRARYYLRITRKHSPINSSKRRVTLGGHIPGKARCPDDKANASGSLVGNTLLIHSHVISPARSSQTSSHTVTLRNCLLLVAYLCHVALCRNQVMAFAGSPPQHSLIPVRKHLSIRLGTQFGGSRWCISSERRTAHVEILRVGITRG